MLNDEQTQLKRIEQNLDKPASAKLNTDGIKKAMGVDQPSKSRPSVKIPDHHKKDDDFQQKEAWRPMAIDLDLQRLDSVLLRGWKGFKYFCQHYIKDWFTCPMILLFLLAIGCAVICWILPFKAVHPVKGLKML